jgi:hypothetical protein
MVRRGTRRRGGGVEGVYIVAAAMQILELKADLRCLAKQEHRGWHAAVK